MKKILILLALVLSILPSILAINLDIEEKSSSNVIIPEINQPAIFNLKITNLGSSDNFQFYNLLGFSMAPKGTVLINSGEAKDIQLIIFPREDSDYRGFQTFKYFIRSEDTTEISQDLTVKIINLKDAFEIGAEELNPESNSFEVYIHNKENLNFSEIDVKFSSAFFDFEEKFSLGTNERKNFDVQLNKEDFKKLLAGFYTLNSEISVDDVVINLKSVIKFVEKDILTTSKKYYGFIINTQIIEKKNEGNVIIKTETVIRKNIISRLFTTFSPEPDVVDRQKTQIYYTWSREILPGETLEIKVKTNWLFPLVIILFIILVVVLAKQYKKTNLVLKKRVSFVKAKGGEFALKVSLVIHAKSHIERVNIVDSFPSLVKIYERFGVEKPTRINEKNRRIEWDFGVLEEGETRIVSYIVYSRVGILGKFALPRATGIYEKDGKIHETQSNKTFFIAEQREKDLEDDE
ncbi:MAG: hypothetical protein IIA85_01150 [Nanoarchaeota archaeon]|nr:hypothetical protein [Nanoarchaeota archaeon]